jgi:hypothetical protein
LVGIAAPVFFFFFHPLLKRCSFLQQKMKEHLDGKIFISLLSTISQVVFLLALALLQTSFLTISNQHHTYHHHRSHYCCHHRCASLSRGCASDCSSS